MSISRILSECPTMQEDIAAVWTEEGRRPESLPLLQYVVSPENSRMIKQMISPGGGKLKTVQVTWNQRLPETEATEGVDILACTATNEYGDNTQDYTLEATDSIGVNQLINKVDIARHCKDNSRYVQEQTIRLLEVLDRKVASVMATQVAAQVGVWGTEVSSFYTVTNSGTDLEIATRQTGGQALNEFALADIQQAAAMANYTGSIIGFGGAEMQRYVRGVMAGCCTQYGIDLAQISAQNGFAFAYDARLTAALGSNNLYNLITTSGAIQWLNFNLASWDGMEAMIGNNYVTNRLVTPAGVDVDVTYKDDCGNLSIVANVVGKVITPPTDLYEASDKYAGVNYVNVVKIVNP